MVVPTIEVLLTQCDISTTRSSGPGGQHVNKTDSAVQLYHRPTGLRLKVSEHRSQYMNKQVALARLRELLQQRELAEVQRRSALHHKKQAKRRPRNVKEKILKNKKLNSVKKNLRKVDY